MGKLDKRVAIVTGGGTGIGAGIALEFAKAGADVVVASRNMANLKETADEISALGRRCLPVVADVSVRDQVRHMVDETVKKFGRIDILVNDAGIQRSASIIDMKEDDLSAMIDTNLKGVFFCIQAVAPHMVRQKYGKIISMGSIAGLRANTLGNSGYGITKAGVTQLTKVAALEIGGYGINVNCIAPGAVETDLQTAGKTQAEIVAWQKTVAKRAIMGRVGTTLDIANLALFLASDDSSFICGETIVCDGGRICQGYLGA